MLAVRWPVAISYCSDCIKLHLSIAPAEGHGARHDGLGYARSIQTAQGSR